MNVIEEIQRIFGWNRRANKCGRYNGLNEILLLKLLR